MGGGGGGWGCWEAQCGGRNEVKLGGEGKIDEAINAIIEKVDIQGVGNVRRSRSGDEISKLRRACRQTTREP